MRRRPSTPRKMRNCLICEAPAPIEGRALIAVETDGNHDIGCICAACATWGLGDA